VNAESQAPALFLEGPLSFESLPDVLARSRAYGERADLPDTLTIDFSKVSQVDSSAVALLLEWRREAARLGKTLFFVSLPANLMALAELYGVAELIQPNRA
jgi:phospholipid transport system transporter-binding protein